MTRTSIVKIFAAVLVLLAIHVLPASADDSYIEGYALSILEREYGLTSEVISVKDSVVFIHTDRLNGADSSRLITDMLSIKGVKRVETAYSGTMVTGDRVINAGKEKKESPISTVIRERGRESLFDPLIADPRWPSFSGAWHHYINDDELEDVFAASVGDLIPLYTGDVPFGPGGKFQVGGSAGAFVIHDLDTNSWDQVNADYIFGLTLAYRKDTLSGLFRIFHQSSHIGDEYLLHNDVERENYSYEALGLTVSKEFRKWIRVYGGGDYRFSRSPDNLRSWVFQYGTELTCPLSYMYMRPVAAADIKHKQDNNYSGEVSLRAGVNVEYGMLSRHRLRLLIGYFNGNSPNGQFYKETEEVITSAFYYNF